MHNALEYIIDRVNLLSDAKIGVINSPALIIDYI